MSNKKEMRRKFRDSVFSRDKNVCRVCDTVTTLDAHHITDRHKMPNGGYILENGISLCSYCHEKAEEFHKTGTTINGFGPDDLYKLIESSYELAYKNASKEGKP